MVLELMINSLVWSNTIVELHQAAGCDGERSSRERCSKAGFPISAPKPLCMDANDHGLINRALGTTQRDRNLLFGQPKSLHIPKNAHQIGSISNWGEFPACLDTLGWL
jgi:hypothetical protein